MATPSFGEFIKDLRRRQGYSLRAFCELHQLDPGNQSKIERGLRPPPSGEQQRDELARWLGLKPGEEDWQTFFDLAAIASGRIPAEILEDETLAGKLPLVFRSLRGEKLDKDQLLEVAELLRRS